jgi:predicted nucleic acid-binding protein
MIKVVCNASPIIGLAILGKLNLLWELFDVIIPGEVYNEVVNLASGSTIGCAELKTAVSNGYIQVYNIIDKGFVNKAYGILHRGELEVVVSALENNIKVVIIDEKTARDFSQTLNLKPLGIIGVLNLAKQKGKITSIKPYLDQLIRNKYRISEKIYHQALQKAGELI